LLVEKMYFAPEYCVASTKGIVAFPRVNVSIATLSSTIALVSEATMLAIK
jgi:hypothetical protein